MTSPYRGRFAPTPSGPLHLGSLLTALASYLDARSAGGQWLLRIDDLDTPRCPPGMDGTILRQLEAHGLHWDEPPRYQSRHLAQYEAAYAELASRAALYPCTCTRARLRRDSPPGPDGPVYAGTCRKRTPLPGPAAWRVHVGAGALAFEDAKQGTVRRELLREVGDFIVRRHDGRIAYQLACVIDEQAQNITHVVRGLDLLGSTVRQVWLQEQLCLPTPRYSHLPIVVDASGRKLSKQNHAPSLADDQPARNLRTCLAWLGQPAPPDELDRPDGLLRWAVAHWSAANVPQTAQVSARHL